MEAGVEAAGDCPADSDLAALGQAPQTLVGTEALGSRKGSTGGVGAPPTIVDPPTQPSSLIRLSLTAAPGVAAGN